MAKRKEASKRMRFEVLKRDKFTCQYCGKSAPDVILHVDHMNPISKGGLSEIINLVTACSDCNLGKSNKKLSDDAVVKKQIIQLKDLEQLRQQKEMMAKWHDELVNMSKNEAQKLSDYMGNEYGVHLNDYGRKELAKTIKKYSFEEVIISMDISAEVYLKNVEDKEQRINFINKIERICFYRKKDREDPIGAEIRRILNLATKKWWNCNRWKTEAYLKSLIERKFTTKDIESMVIRSTGIMGLEDLVRSACE